MNVVKGRGVNLGPVQSRDGQFLFFHELTVALCYTTGWDTLLSPGPLCVFVWVWVGEAWRGGTGENHRGGLEKVSDFNA